MQVQELQTQIETSYSLPSIHVNRRRSYLVIKRMSDFFISGLALVIMFPIFLLAAVAIKVEDPRGAIFYKQLRGGKDGVPFVVYKFRSMYSNADEIKASLMDQNEMDGPVFKIRNDPRVTKVGRVIRKLSIDEFPQFFNVFQGRLSLVGPRPLPIAEAEACNPYQKQRELVKPGITCTWQISGRNNVSFERWMEMDIEYIAKQSLWVDFMILLKTIPAVFSSNGAS